MADFLPAITLVLKHEGGFQKDTHDRGNWTSGQIGVGELKGTNYGISAMTYPNEDIAGLTKERAEQIYQRDFWRYSPITSQAVANKVFDMSVNMGRIPANRLLQQSCCNLGSPVPVDGLPGPRTFAAVNDLEGRMPGSVLEELKRLAAEHYQRIAANNPVLAKFLPGWLQRAES